MGLGLQPVLEQGLEQGLDKIPVPQNTLYVLTNLSVSAVLKCAVSRLGKLPPYIHAYCLSKQRKDLRTHKAIRRHTPLSQAYDFNAGVSVLHYVRI
jgi:hypothetical protein